MPEPKLGKIPTELFGYPYTDLGDLANRARQNQFCPYLNGECKKPRKSEPHIKVGICSVGYKGEISDEYIPVIICPHRFEIKNITSKIEELYFPDLRREEENILWAPEVYLGSTLGTVDYAGVRVDKSDILLNSVKDFVCVEIQAAGTTGTPWEAVLEHKETGAYSRNSYSFGINWANEFAKTMMQQAYKKGQLFAQWEKKIIFVIQDVALRYLESAYDTSGLHEVDMSEHIHFCTFKVIWDENDSKWSLNIDRRISTNIEGIRKILGGSTGDGFPTQEEFITRFKSKYRPPLNS